MTVKEKANKMHAMTDEELVAYVENRVRKAHSEGFNMGYCLRSKDIDDLKDYITDMHDYIVDISADIKYNYSDDLLTYIDGIYTIIRKMGRR
nr:MAG TPA: hypothetical protein [Caudoviricetes sp.]